MKWLVVKLFTGNFCVGSSRCKVSDYRKVHVYTVLQFDMRLTLLLNCYEFQSIKYIYK